MTPTAAQAKRATGDEAGAFQPRQLEMPYPHHKGVAEHLNRLRDFSTRMRFLRNETIFSQGDAAAHILTMVSGCVRLCRNLPDGRRHIPDFMFPGDIFGLSEQAAYATGAEAVGLVTLAACPRSYFERLCEGNARVRSDLLAHLASRLASAQQHLFVISCQSARERLAWFLVNMCDRGNLFGDRLDVPMGRQDIADYLGLTIETICRAIAVLKSEGMIDVPNAHQFVIRKAGALRALADGRNPHLVVG